VSALVRSELLKVRTTRGWWAYLIVTVLLTGLAVATDIGDTPGILRSLPEFQVGLVDSAWLAALLAIVLGITIVTAEFRHGTITPTLLAEPRRERIIAGKGLAIALVAALFAVLALLVVTVVAVTWLSLVGADLHLAEAEIGKRAAQVILAVVLWGLLGGAIGAVVHSQVAALVGTLVWLFLGEMLVGGLLGLLDLDGVRAYLPFSALDAADGTGGEDRLSYWPAVAVSLAWIAAIGAAGTLRTRRRDIT
jgi:ABC-type transport system involved in multi-copper enzyme maturation permease subunit